MEEVETVSVDDAIDKGIKRVYLPGFAIFILGLISFFPIVAIFNVSIWLAMLIPLLGSILLSWLWWSYSVARWKVWAYKRVDDIEKLEQRAIDAQIINKRNRYGRISSKTEFLTKKEKLEIELLRSKKLKSPVKEVIEDDGLKEETVIFYEPNNNLHFYGYFQIFMGLLVLIFIPDLYIASIILFVFGIFFIYLQKSLETKQKKNKHERYLKVNANEVEHYMYQPVSWEDIKNYRFGTKGYGSNTKSILFIDTTDETIEINIENADKTAWEILHVFDVYKGRFEKGKSLKHTQE